MRKTFVFLFLIISLSAQATTYYVTTAANGGSNSHTSTQAQTSSTGWSTLSYACSQVPAGSHIIHVNAGTYTESSQCVLAVGVSIEGDGVTSLLNCTLSTGPTLLLSSSSEGINGNQHISNIKMSGGSGTNSYTAYAPIAVIGRSNVEIYNCTFQYFSLRGVQFKGNINTEPTTYITGNKFHDNIVTDCCSFTGIGTSGGSGWGGLEIGDQQGFLCYNNTITVGSRTGYIQGYNIKYANGGYNKGLKIHDNTFNRPPNCGTSLYFDFSIELWNGRGGLEVYNNVMNGGLDFGGDNSAPNTDAGGYGYTAKVYGNAIGWSIWQGAEESGIELERAITGGIYIYNNKFTNCSLPIIFQPLYDSRAHDVVEDVYIYYNIFQNVGNSSNHYSEAILIGGGGSSGAGIIYRRISIINNTFVQGSGGGGTETGISLSFHGTASYIYIQNNIISGFGAGAAGIQGSAISNDGTSLVSLTHLTVQDNLYYNNYVDGFRDFYSGTESYDVNSNVTPANPVFVSTTDFHLQSSSPAINHGIHITTPALTVDYDNVSLGNPPEIGAYEYGSFTVPTVMTTAATNIAVTTASCGGNITTDGGATITERGVCYGTSANPTIVGVHTFGGTGIGSFSLSLSGLTATTLYHFRAYATNSQGTSYGSDAQFTTLTAVAIPTVSTTSITGIGTTIATGGGNVTSDGGASVTAKGVCWNTTSYPSIVSPHTSDGTGTGSFISSIVGLSPGTIYHIRAYATNSAGTAYGSDVQFTTTAQVTTPVLTTTAISAITVTTAASGGIITSDGGGSVTARGVAYSTSSNPVVAGSHTTNGSGTGPFVSNLTGLTPNTLYHVRAYATNSAGTSYGSDISFTTLNTLTIPVLTTSIVTVTTTTSATVGGNITSDGGATVIDRGVCYGTSLNPDTTGTHSHVGAGTGIFSVLITGLTSGTQYHVRAWAVNSEGINFGSDVTFIPRSFIIMIKR